MRIVSIGGGPAGLYFALLMKKAKPEADITVLERNRPDDTFGWGVVFSDETLGNFEREDPESMARIRASFRYWGEIETHYGGEVVTSTGHGFCGLSRKSLLRILQDRARELGVKLEFGHEVRDLDALRREADLVIGADGVNSGVRARYAEFFQPSLDHRKCKFSWLGTDKTLRAFTFVFEENEHGLFQVHAYPFEEGRSTWIVECREETWKKAGLDGATEEDTVRYCEKLFAKYLDGHRLLSNRSVWRTFPTVVNARWHHENVVIVGDAAHTAHFSIGSGTKLAMEDAIALVDTFKKHGTRDVPAALAAYQAARYDETRRLQRAAQTSLEWFETSARYQKQDPVLFSFNLMTRSKRITYDNLALRDPALVQRATERFAEATGAPREPSGKAPAPMFTPFALRGLSLANRIVVSPMCQYSAVDGVPTDWHLVHLGSRAVGGAGLVITEMTDVSPEGRITHGCAGLWGDAHEAAYKRIVDFVHGNSAAKIGIQLAHAGRKGSCTRPWEGDRPLRADEGAWETIGPSALPFDDGWHTPREMTRADMERVIADFAEATRRSLRAGFDLVELHMAHGYLLSSFLSPLSNRRTDAYGGSLENRARFPLEVLDAVRAAWPADKPVSVRISATDWVPDGGMTIEESVILARWLAARGCDVVDVSSGGNSPDSEIVYGRMYQVPFAEQIRYEAGVPTMAVGAIQGADHANTVLAAERADLCALARPHLSDPYLTMHAAVRYGHADQPWPDQYLAVRRIDGAASGPKPQRLGSDRG
ncbi:Anthraniloyl-CoA monooxygenase [Minicystis rosea]|nr:Anthraniloyl-CoA monooxygenase [Minicystis rosea]